MINNILSKSMIGLFVFFCFSTFAMEKANYDNVLCQDLDKNIKNYIENYSEQVEKHCNGSDPRLAFFNGRSRNLKIGKVFSSLLLSSIAIYLLTSDYFDIKSSFYNMAYVCAPLFNMWKEIYESLREVDIKTIKGKEGVEKEFEIFSGINRLCKFYFSLDNDKINALNLKLEEEIFSKTAIGLLIEKIHLKQFQRPISLSEVFLSIVRVFTSKPYKELVSEHCMLSICGYEEYSSWLDEKN